MNGRPAPRPIVDLERASMGGISRVHFAEEPDARGVAQLAEVGRQPSPFPRSCGSRPAR